MRYQTISWLSVGLVWTFFASAQYYDGSSRPRVAGTGSIEYDPFGRVIGPVTTAEAAQPYPTGIAEYAGEWYSIPPLVCGHGCWVPVGVYSYCEINTTLPDGRIANQNECDQYLCDVDNFTFLSACLNCVIANGGERALGYNDISSDGSTSSSRPSLYPLPSVEPEGGYLDTALANEWIGNIVDRCGAAGLAILADGVTTITASPTTTGPYSTAWTRGQTLTFATWTGLTPFPDQILPTVTPVWGPVETDSRGSVIDSALADTSTGTSRPSDTSTTPRAPSAAASSSNAGLARSTIPISSWIMTASAIIIMGMNW